jgi:hypothetical protein
MSPLSPLHSSAGPHPLHSSAPSWPQLPPFFSPLVQREQPQRAMVLPSSSRSDHPHSLAQIASPSTPLSPSPVTGAAPPRQDLPRNHCHRPFTVSTSPRTTLSLLKQCSTPLPSFPELQDHPGALGTTGALPPLRRRHAARLCRPIIAPLLWRSSAPATLSGGCTVLWE